MDRGQGCGSIRGGTEDGIHPIYSKSYLVLSSHGFQRHHLKTYVTLGMPHSWHLRSPTLDGPTVGRRATNRATFYDNTISHWKYIPYAKEECTSHPILLYSIQECAILITDLHALKHTRLLMPEPLLSYKRSSLLRL